MTNKLYNELKFILSFFFFSFVRKVLKYLKELSSFPTHIKENTQILGEFKSTTNDVYLISVDGKKYILKYCKRGWCRYEYSSMKKLYELGYDVPKPIFYYTIKEMEDDSWSYGNLKREEGILIYEYIEGRPISNIISEKVVKDVINLMKTLHNDERLVGKPNFDYKKAEINRVLFYTEKLNLRDIRDKILELFDEPEEYRFIHGDFRPQNIIESKGKLFMIDFEGSCYGDPMKDLGTFIIELERLCHVNKFCIPVENILKLYGNFDENRLRFYMIRRLMVIARYDKNMRKWAISKIKSILQSSEIR